MKNQKGFSLIELLVVVIIIAIIAAIAIPSLLASRRAANQSATVANLRTVVSANATYVSLSTARSYGVDFAEISGANADYLDDSWTGAPVKNGYTYTMTVNGAAGAVDGYCVTATTTAASGDFAYAVSHQGVIYQVATPATAPVCVANGGAITGTVVGS